MSPNGQENALDLARFPTGITTSSITYNYIMISAKCKFFDAKNTVRGLQYTILYWQLSAPTAYCTVLYSVQYFTFYSTSTTSSQQQQSSTSYQINEGKIPGTGTGNLLYRYSTVPDLEVGVGGLSFHFHSQNHRSHLQCTVSVSRVTAHESRGGVIHVFL